MLPSLTFLPPTIHLDFARGIDSYHIISKVHIVRRSPVIVLATGQRGKIVTEKERGYIYQVEEAVSIVELRSASTQPFSNS